MCMYVYTYIYIYIHTYYSIWLFKHMCYYITMLIIIDELLLLSVTSVTILLLFATRGPS